MYNDPVVAAIQEGHPAILVTNNTDDFIVSDGKAGFRKTLLADSLIIKGYTPIHYSLSSGLNVHDYSNLPKEKRAQIDQDMKAIGLTRLLKSEREVNPEEILQIMRDMSRLLQLPPRQGIRYIWLIHYLEHLVQNSSSPGSLETMVAIETLHRLSYSVALRKSGNAVVCVARSGMQNALLNDLYQVEYPYPSEKEIAEFTQVMIDRLEGV